VASVGATAFAADLKQLAPPDIASGDEFGQAVAAIGGLVDSDGNDLLVSAEVTQSNKGATLEAQTPLVGGDYRVTISPRGDAGGDVEWTVQLKSPKGYVFELADVAVERP